MELQHLSSRKRKHTPNLNTHSAKLFKSSISPQISIERQISTNFSSNSTTMNPQKTNFFYNYYKSHLSDDREREVVSKIVRKWYILNYFRPLKEKYKEEFTKYFQQIKNFDGPNFNCCK